jgi:hypothetical protein
MKAQHVSPSPELAELEVVPVWLLIRGLAISCLAVLACAGLFLCVRSAGGELSGELGSVVLAAWAAILAASALGFRRALDATNSFATQSADLAGIAPSVVLLLWAVALTGLATSAGAVVLWSVIIAEEAWSWGGSRNVSSRRLMDPLSTSSIAASGIASRAEPGTALADAQVPVETPLDDASVIQHFDRRKTEDGQESVEGWLRATIPAGSRLATLHVAICPPFDRLPKCYAEQVDGPPAQIKIAQVLHQGVRLEVKLERPADQDSLVTVEVSLQQPLAS